MSFVETTQKMADEVACSCVSIDREVARLASQATTIGAREFAEKVGSLARAVEKLARCVARRFPERDE